jgi:hypothetical protein
VGIGFWAHTADVPAEDLWREGMEALVRGLAPPSA